MPTSLIKKHISELATSLRNQDSYDDWTVGLEPIPNDKTWVTFKNCSSANTDRFCEEELSKPLTDPSRDQAYH